MPLFELAKALLVKAAHRRGQRRKVWKVMFADVYSARLYAPVGPEVKVYVDLPPECGKLGMCGLLGYWLQRHTGGKKSIPGSSSTLVSAMGRFPIVTSTARLKMYCVWHMVKFSPSRGCFRLYRR